jgi:hypothetical protein
MQSRTNEYNDLHDYFNKSANTHAGLDAKSKDACMYRRTTRVESSLDFR